MRSIFNDTYAIFFTDFLNKSICYWYSFELPQQVEAVQMSTHNIYCNLKITKLLDSALRGVCVVN